MTSRAINQKNPCKNVSEYLKHVNDIRAEWEARDLDSRGDRNVLWFRGQRSAKWDLSPRIYRPEYEGAEESEIRLEFEGHGLQLAPTSHNRTKWEWYFLMQHYGAPTRLLDWTENSLAALYFATIGEQEDVREADASVWVFDPWRWNRLHFDGLWGPALPEWQETKLYLPDLEDASDGVRVQKSWPISIDAPSIDRRLASQTARFLLFGKKKDLVKAAARTDKNRNGSKRSRLRQVIIARKELEIIRAELDDLGVNHRILFPDLQGLGTYLSWKWKSFPKD